MGRKIFQDGEVACSRKVPAGHTCPSRLTRALRHAALAPSCLLPQLSTEGCWTRLEGLQQLMEVMLTIKRASKGEESLSFTAQVLHGFPCPRAGKVGRWELWVQSASTAVLSQGLLGRQLLICFGMYKNGLKSNLGIKGGKKTQHHHKSRMAALQAHRLPRSSREGCGHCSKGGVRVPPAAASCREEPRGCTSPGTAARALQLLGKLQQEIITYTSRRRGHAWHQSHEFAKLAQKKGKNHCLQRSPSQAEICFPSINSNLTGCCAQKQN